MSRSYKKVPYSGDKKDKFMKNYANRILRRNKYLVLNNKSYKKNFEKWNICDYYFIENFKSYFKIMKNLYPEMTDKEIYIKWYRYYKMK